RLQGRDRDASGTASLGDTQDETPPFRCDQLTRCLLHDNPHRRRRVRRGQGLVVQRGANGHRAWVRYEEGVPVVDTPRPGPVFDHISIVWGGIRSHTRQNSPISCGLPSDTLMCFVMERIGGATTMLFFLKWSMAASAGPPVFSMTKFACESMTRSMRALAWL